MYDAFFLLGFVLVAGFVSNVLFERTRISPALLLMALGYVVGPVLGLVDSSSSSFLASIAPFVGALALSIMLFDGGIALNVFEFFKVLPRTFVFTIMAFVLSIAVTAGVAILLLGYPPLYGLLLGAAVGGTSSAIVIALARKATNKAEVRDLLVLESTLTDALCIIAAFVLLQLITAQVALSPTQVMSLIASAFSIAAVAGIVGAVAWLFALKKLSYGDFPYMMTLAMIFLLYGIVEAVGGNGGIAVFIFGLALGNARRIVAVINVDGDWGIDEEIVRVQGEITFLVRTFFFVYVGSIISVSGVTLSLLAASVAIVVLLYLVRAASSRLVVGEDNDVIAGMMPRGLAAAVLAGLPAASGLVIVGFQQIAFLVIIATNVVATASVILFGQPGKQSEDAPAAPRIVTISTKKAAK